MDATKRYALSPQAALRRERFGGLVYRYDNRRLYFVHSKAMVDFLDQLDGSQPLDATLDGFLAARKLPAKQVAAQKASFLTAMQKLESLEVLHEL
jgi:putative mycofactocin binding protein MftB